jgi:hypothetical protein
MELGRSATGHLHNQRPLGAALIPRGAADAAMPRCVIKPRA